MTELEKVEVELGKYEHPLVRFSARRGGDGSVELIIEPRQPADGLHTYVAPVHPRDIAHPQFPWTFQRYVYDCLHDYIVELFTRTPQIRERPA